MSDNNSTQPTTPPPSIFDSITIANTTGLCNCCILCILFILIIFIISLSRNELKILSNLKNQFNNN